MESQRLLSPGILFLCVANSARSQLAEGLARTRFGPRVRVASAGSVPTRVNPLTIAVLEEIGVDSSEQYAKSIDTIDPASVDIVVTLCAEEVCPASLGNVRRLHWPLSDPAVPAGSVADQLDQFRAVRDAIEKRLSELETFTA